MKSYAYEIYEFLQQNSRTAKQHQGRSIIEYLTQCYIEDHPVASAQIQQIQAELAPYYEMVSFAVSERLFELLYTLCGAYEKAAFQDGLLVGFRLAEELNRMDG